MRCQVRNTTAADPCPPAALGLGLAQAWEQMGQAETELLLHEMDHLDGVLSVDIAVGGPSVASPVVVTCGKCFFFLFEHNNGFGSPSQILRCRRSKCASFLHALFPMPHHHQPFSLPPLWSVREQGHS